MRTAFIETLIQLAEKDKNICLLTGDLGFSVLEKFASAYPDRFFNAGVAEANMAGMATGLALDGWVPYIYSIATFASMRGYEQIRNGAVLHRLPVRIIGIGGGFAYSHAGPTHHALEDIAIMRVQPGLTVIAPSDPAQTRSALLATAGLKGPVYYRIGKGGEAAVPGLDGRFNINSVEMIWPGREVLLLTTGGIAGHVVEIAREMGNATVGIVAILNPTPLESLTQALQGFKSVFSIEEHYSQGGLGSLTAEVIAASGRGVAFRAIGIQDLQAGITGSRNFMWKHAGLDKAAVLSQIKSTLANRPQ